MGSDAQVAARLKSMLPAPPRKKRPDIGGFQSSGFYIASMRMQRVDAKALVCSNPLRVTVTLFLHLWMLLLQTYHIAGYKTHPNSVSSAG